MDDPPLMRIPPEIRIIIYSHLLSTNYGTQSPIAIRNKLHPPTALLSKSRRSSYYVLERAISLPCYKTTYGLTTSSPDMHPSIMCVNRRIREEASHYLYGTHEFDFGADLEAVTPFLTDMTDSTRELIGSVAVRKRAPMNALESDSSVWASMCRSLSTLPNLKKIRLVIEGGQPDRPWDGPPELSASDIRLLYVTKHDCLEWARDLLEVKVEGLEIVADVRTIPPPKTSEMLVFAALSGSIEAGLVEWLREMGMNARAGSRSYRS